MPCAAALLFLLRKEFSHEVSDFYE
jgi:hypothetical protein